METQCVYCLGCGGNLTSMPRERRNLGAESKAAARPRERVLSSCTAILSGELMSQSLSIENTIEAKCAISVSVNMTSIRSIHSLKIGNDKDE